MPQSPKRPARVASVQRPNFVLDVLLEDIGHIRMLQIAHEAKSYNSNYCMVAVFNYGTVL